MLVCRLAWLEVRGSNPRLIAVGILVFEMDLWNLADMGNTATRKLQNCSKILPPAVKSDELRAQEVAPQTPPFRLTLKVTGRLKHG